MMAVEEEHLHNFELLLPSSDQFFFTTPAGSELSSPIGSDELSYSSTESSQEEEEEEDDDYIGELTRQMAQSMLHDEDKLEKPWGLSGSPESTLWSQFESNHDSPIGPSREPSPPLIPMVENFEKVKVNEETGRYNQGEGFSNTFNSVQVSGGNLNARFQSKQALIDEQIRAIQFYRLKHEQAMKQMEQKPRSKHSNQSKEFPWYKLQQQQRLSNQPAGSQMRAVFLNPPGSKNGSCGTGVFLPRGIGETPTESRKKQASKKGCATVLIPARVVQALKLHFEKTGVPIPPTRSNDCAFPLQHDACVSGRNNNNNNMSSGQKGDQSKPVLPAQEMSLPQEWTY